MSKKFDLDFDDIAGGSENSENLPDPPNLVPVEKKRRPIDYTIAIPYGKRFKAKDLALCTDEEFFRFLDFILPGRVTKEEREQEKDKHISTDDRLRLVQAVETLNKRGGILRFPKLKE